MFKSSLFLIITIVLNLGSYSIIKAEEIHPRLFVNSKRINQLKSAIQVPSSHHQQAFLALKNRVEQNDWRIYGYDGGNWNYARSHLAKESALLYLLTNEPKYAQISYQNIEAIYEQPDPDNRLPDRNYGLSRAMVGSHMAIAYDWAYHGMTQTQREYIKNKINNALSAWLDYQHGNLRSTHLGSNWVAVCRGGELVMMLAVYEEKNRAERYQQLKQWLKTHLINAYGELGLSQEGIGYTSYGSTFLLPALYALESVGDSELEPYFQEIDFWRLIMYAGAFFMHENGERHFLQSGVSYSGIIDEGWASLLLNAVPSLQLPFYRYFYDYHMGIKAEGTPTEKFDDRRGATVWALIYYPETAPSFDPTGIYPQAISDQKRGAYFFRNRWQDEDDILLSIMGDLDFHGNAWDQAEAFQLGLLSHQTRFIDGPATKYDNPDVYSSLLVDGKASTKRTTGRQKLFTTLADGGYVIIDGGEKYQSLGIEEVERHLLIRFQDSNQAIWTTLDRINDSQDHTYTWQINLGDNQFPLTSSTNTENGINTFTIQGKKNGYLKGWVINPDSVEIKIGDPLQVKVFGSDTDLWIVLISGQGIPPTAKLEGKGMSAQLVIGNQAVVSYDRSINRLMIDKN